MVRDFVCLAQSCDLARAGELRIGLAQIACRPWSTCSDVVRSAFSPLSLAVLTSRVRLWPLGGLHVCPSVVERLHSGRAARAQGYKKTPPWPHGHC